MERNNMYLKVVGASFHFATLGYNNTRKAQIEVGLFNPVVYNSKPNKSWKKDFQHTPPT